MDILHLCFMFLPLQFGNVLVVSMVLCDLLVSSTSAKYLHLALCILSPPYTVYSTLYFIDRVSMNISIQFRA